MTAGGSRPGAGRKSANLEADTAPYLLRIIKARADKEESKAFEGKIDAQEKLEEHKRKKGDLVSRSEVERLFLEYVDVVVMVLNTLPDMLERDTGISSEAVGKVQSSVDKIRRDLYGRLESQFGKH